MLQLMGATPDSRDGEARLSVTLGAIGGLGARGGGMSESRRRRSRRRPKSRAS